MGGCLAQRLAQGTHSANQGPVDSDCQCSLTGPVSWAGCEGLCPDSLCLPHGFICSPSPPPGQIPAFSPLPAWGSPGRGPLTPVALGAAEAALSLMMWEGREEEPEMELLLGLSRLSGLTSWAQRDAGEGAAGPGWGSAGAGGLDGERGLGA